MPTAKDTLKSILNKVETGSVTIEDIHKAQSILDSSVIIASPHDKFKKMISSYQHGRRQPYKYQLGLESISRRGDYYTVQEVAERFKVSDKAVYKWIEQNKIRYERSNEKSRDIRIPKAQFNEPPSKEKVSRQEMKLFKNAVDMELVRRKDLYRDEDET